MERTGAKVPTPGWLTKLHEEHKRLEDEVDTVREENQKLQSLVDEAEAIFSYGVFHHTRVKYPFWHYWFRWRDDVEAHRRKTYPTWPEGWQPL